MKARIWRQRMLALNLFTGCPFSLCERAGEKGLPNLLVLGAEGFRLPGERASAVPPTGPRVRSLGGGFQAVHTVCSQSGSSSQLQYMQVDVCGAGVPSW